MAAADSTPSRSGLRSADTAGRPEIAEKLLRLRRFVAMCSHLSAAAAQQSDLDAIVDLLASATGSSVTVLDRGLEVLAEAGPRTATDILSIARAHAGTAGFGRILSAAARNRRALQVPGHGRETPVGVAPVSVGKDLAGYLLSTAEPDGHNDAGLGEDLMLLAGEHAAMVCGVLLGRDLVVTAAAGRARRELVEGLLLARDIDRGEATQWAQHLGYDESLPHAVAVVPLPRDSEAPATAAVVEQVLGAIAPEAILAVRTDEVVAVLPGPAADRPPGGPGRAELPAAVARALELTEGLVEELHRRGVVVPAIGIGNECRVAARVARSYSEARRALTAGLRSPVQGTVVPFAELGVHRLLLQFPDPAELRRFGDEVLGQLFADGSSTGTDLLTTLSVYFEENSSPSRTARRLHVHPNTVAYRLRRIEEITGLRLDLHRDRLMAEIAVEIIEGSRYGS
ncbi:helix-turn-helix domain-containing protein [Pseudonocardia sp. NPDC046786]|uniref:PucR family transcriptional regulator n=1 Tax=Pseudonocardia sp. NPDC046786 TaxID=3155471 RepID=UPI0033C691E9